jgi:hypothetical protein
MSRNLSSRQWMMLLELILSSRRKKGLELRFGKGISR